MPTIRRQGEEPPTSGQFHQHFTRAFFSSLRSFFCLHVTREKLPKRLSYKNTHLKCWWYWHQFSKQNKFLESLDYIEKTHSSVRNKLIRNITKINRSITRNCFSSMISSTIAELFIIAYWEKCQLNLQTTQTENKIFSNLKRSLKTTQLHFHLQECNTIYLMM